jgi:O-methyltransferase
MLSDLRAGISRRVLTPWIRRGWRPGRSTPLADPFLAAPRGFDDEQEIDAAIRTVRDFTMCSYERLATLWQQVRYLDRYAIEGSFVECGTWRGGAVGMMALAHTGSGARPTRTLHLFDSFEGLPEPTANDGGMAESYAAGRTSGTLETIGKCEGPLEDNKELLERRIGYPSDLLEYHVGWFQDTVARDAAKTGPIALLRLDGDWYESTKTCLDALYPLVQDGGVVVIDDYGHWAGCRRAVDEFIDALAEPVLLGQIDYTGRYWVKHTP